MRNAILIVLLLAACDTDEGSPDAAPSPDAEPCGETWGRCCANDAPQGRCNPEAICNISEICEAMCFPYCTDGGY